MLKDVSIEITQKCLNHCVHCSSCSTERSSLMLPFEVLVSVIEGLSHLNVERVCLSGGEPFLHPDIIHIVETISKQGMVADIYTSGIVGTCDNPSPLTVEVLKDIKKSGLHALLFNLQTTKEKTYDLISQRKGHLSVVYKSIHNAVKCGIRTEIHFVPMKQNIDDAEAVIRYAEKAGVEQINFLKLVPHGRARENSNLITPNNESLIIMQHQLHALKNKGKHIRIGLPLLEQGDAPPCHAVKEKLYIKFDGSVFGCEAFKYITFDNREGPIVRPDNIYCKSIEEIYKTSEYLKQSLELVREYEDIQVGCENCPVQKYLKDSEDKL